MEQIISRWWVRVLTIGIFAAGSFVLAAEITDNSADEIITKQTISDWSDLQNSYLNYRAGSYRMLPPLADMTAEEFLLKGSSIQNDPDWYWVFNGGIIYVDDLGELSKLSRKLPLYAIIYEDMINNEIVIETVDKQSREVASFIAPVWDAQTYEQTADEYTAIELGKRRVVWKVELRSAKELTANELASTSSTPLTPLMMMNGGTSITNIIITDIAKLTNGNLQIEISYPVGYSADLDIFTVDGGTGLLDFWWKLAATTNVSTSTNYISWIDTDAVNAAGGIRFYAASNADTNSPGVDEDFDSLSWGREHFLYHTSPTNSDTDFDGYSDYDEVINRHTDPNNNDTTSPSISLHSPADETERIALP